MKPEVSIAIPPLSQSRHGLLACPHLYVQRVILGIEEPENEYARRGTQIHEALAAYVTHLVATRQPSDWEFFAKLLEAGYCTEAIEILEGLKESLVIDPEKVLGAELYLALDEGDLKPAEFARKDDFYKDDIGYEGTLDLVTLEDEHTAIIDDYKSFWQIIEPETFQAKLYPLLVFQHYPSIETVRFRLQFVRYGVERSVEYTRDEVPKLMALARRERHRQLALHDEAKRELLNQPMPGAHCAYCPKLMPTGGVLIPKHVMSKEEVEKFRDEWNERGVVSEQAKFVSIHNGCPISEINPYVTQSIEDRLRFAVWAAQAAKVNNGVLRDLVAAAGPAEITDANGTKYRAEHKLVEQAKFPLMATVDVVATWREQTGEDLMPKLMVGSTELKPLLKAKKRIALREAVESVKTVKAGSRWTVGKVGDEDESEE